MHIVHSDIHCQGKCREFESHRPLQIFQIWLNILSHVPRALVHADGGIDNVFTHTFVENS
jgi:hypothetical protein